MFAANWRIPIPRARAAVAVPSSAIPKRLFRTALPDPPRRSAVSEVVKAMPATDDPVVPDCSVRVVSDEEGPLIPTQGAVAPVAALQPSIATGPETWGSALASVIVLPPVRGAAKSISSPPPLSFALRIASRSVPTPVSALLVTV